MYISVYLHTIICNVLYLIEKAVTNAVQELVYEGRSHDHMLFHWSNKFKLTRVCGQEVKCSFVHMCTQNTQLMPVGLKVEYSNKMINDPMIQIKRPMGPLKMN